MNWKHNFTVHQNYEVQAHLFTYSFKLIDPSIVTDFQDIQFLKVQSIFIAAKEAMKELLCFFPAIGKSIQVHSADNSAYTNIRLLTN